MGEVLSGRRFVWAMGNIGDVGDMGEDLYGRWAIGDGRRFIWAKVCIGYMVDVV